MKLVFLGTPQFAVKVLDILAASRHSVAGVVCRPDKPKGRNCCPSPPEAKVYAVDHCLPVQQPGRLGADFLAWLDKVAPDALAVAAYGKLLPPEVIHYGRFGCINLHPSLLPHLRGAAPVQWTIANGDPEAGVTVMQMDEGLDSGPILLQQHCPLFPDDTSETLMDRLAEAGGHLLVQALDGLEDGTLKPQPQDESKVTLAPILERDHGRIDWTQPAPAIARRVRGFHPWPGAFTHGPDGKVVKLFPLPVELPLKGAPGTFLGLREGLLCVACGEGALGFPEVQLEGRCRTPAAEFLKGSRWEPGLRLG